tara:strand:+ start:7279 stop:7566 length:288 start_codon:yes stop_codon:yes gene_type:complete
MVKKKITLSEELLELRRALQDGKATLGTDRTLKALKTGKAKKIFMAKNCPQNVISDVEHLCKVAECNIIKLDLDNEELGVFCKKNFFVSILCLEE